MGLVWTKVARHSRMYSASRDELTGLERNNYPELALIAERVAQKVGVPRQFVLLILSYCFEEIVNSVLAYAPVVIPGFGRFSLYRNRFGQSRFSFVTARAVNKSIDKYMTGADAIAALPERRQYIRRQVTKLRARGKQRPDHVGRKRLYSPHDVVLEAERVRYMAELRRGGIDIAECVRRANG